MPYPVYTTIFKMKKEPLDAIINPLELDDVLKRRISDALAMIGGSYKQPSFFRPNPIEAAIKKAIRIVTTIQIEQSPENPIVEKLDILINYLKQPLDTIIEEQEEVTWVHTAGPGRED